MDGYATQRYEGEGEREKGSQKHEVSRSLTINLIMRERRRRGREGEREGGREGRKLLKT